MDHQTIFNCIQGVSCCVQEGSTPLTPPLDKYSPGRSDEYVLDACVELYRRAKCTDIVVRVDSPIVRRTILAISGKVVEAAKCTLSALHLCTL